MNQKTGKYKIAKAAGGVGHYAEAIIQLQQSSLGLDLDFSHIVDADISWIHAALDGAKAVLAEIGNTEWEVYKLLDFNGVVSDTSDQCAWLAGAMATLDALDKVNNVKALDYNKPNWVIRFNDDRSIISTTR